MIALPLVSNFALLDINAPAAPFFSAAAMNLWPSNLFPTTGMNSSPALIRLLSVDMPEKPEEAPSNVSFPPVAARTSFIVSIICIIAKFHEKLKFYLNLCDKYTGSKATILTRASGILRGKYYKCC